MTSTITMLPPAPTKVGAMVFSDAHLLALLCYLSWEDGTLSRNGFMARRDDGDPIAHLYELRFGSWNAALEAAGLEATPQPTQLQGVTTKWTVEMMCAAIALCRIETGSTTVAVYEAWRTHPSNNNTPIPPAASIRARLGKWSTATAAACDLAAGPVVLEKESTNP